jgi:polygalacturonase
MATLMLHVVVAVALPAAALVPAAIVDSSAFDITTFGAQPCPSIRGKVFKLLCPENSHAIVAAFAAAAAAGGGTVVVPPGRWTSMPFHVTSHTTLKLAAGATLQAVIERQPGSGIAEWPLIDPMPSYAGGFDFQGSSFRKHQPFIFGYQVRNVSIEGPGTVDGAGVYWLSRVAYTTAPPPVRSTSTPGMPLAATTAATPPPSMPPAARA